MPLYFNVLDSILLEKFKDVLGYVVKSTLPQLFVP